MVNKVRKGWEKGFHVFFVHPELRQRGILNIDEGELLKEEIAGRSGIKIRFSLDLIRLGKVGKKDSTFFLYTLNYDREGY